MKSYLCYAFATLSLLSCVPQSAPPTEKPAIEKGVLIVETESSQPIKLRRTNGCGPVPSDYRRPPYQLDSFYQQYCDADGIPVIGSSSVRPRALRVIRTRALAMTQMLSPSVKQAMIDSSTRIAIIAQDELTTDIPEHSDLYEMYPDTDWNERTRGLGATPERPVSSSAEENALCLKGDRYAGADIFVHEFAHTIHKLGLNKAEPDFERHLNSAYSSAIKRGLWKETYAGSSASEYWAEGVQTWFNLNFEIRKGIHNHVNTRAELKHYDRQLYDLMARHMPTTSLLMCSQ